LQKTRDGLRYLSVEEWHRLLSIEKNSRDQLIIELLYETGCTVNELVNICSVDLDIKKSILKIRKQNARNNEARSVFVSVSLISKIEAFCKENKSSQYVFGSRQSNQITTKRVRQVVAKWCRDIGVSKASPQILRYTHIVHAYQKNIPLDAIRSQVGLKRSRAIEIFSQLPVQNIKGAYQNFNKNV